jgi:hypothetical protein
MLLGNLSECSEFVDPGIRRQHIDMPGFCLYGCVDAVEVGKICRIAPDRCGIAADPRDSLVQFGLMAAGDKPSPIVVTSPMDGSLQWCVSPTTILALRCRSGAIHPITR